MSVRAVWWHPATVPARLAELTLAGLGIGYVFIAGTPDRELELLAWWLVVAVLYLGIGFVVVRRGRNRAVPDEPAPPPWVAVLRRRSSFAFTVLASLTGLGAAIDVLHESAGERGIAVRIVGVLAVVSAWLLLHVGYAKFYRSLEVGQAEPGLRFPEDARPALVDYLYFALTVGVSFAASDVEVIRRDTRWHVLVHSVVAFFYNTAVLAIAVGVVTART